MVATLRHLVAWFVGLMLSTASRLLAAVHLLPAARAAKAGPKWDAKLGVWVGERAAGGSAEIPDPLWIFGYGRCVVGDENELSATCFTFSLESRFFT